MTRHVWAEGTDPPDCYCVNCESKFRMWNLDTATKEEFRQGFLDEGILEDCDEEFVRLTMDL